MDTLKTIDEGLSDYLSRLNDYAETLSFTPEFIFNLTHASLASVSFDKLSFSGLYFIEIKCDALSQPYQTWVDDFQVSWRDEKFKHKFVANPKKGRINSHKELKEWMPLYIGKSHNVGKRVKEHIYLGLDKPTFALKLLSREQLANDFFRVSSIRLDVQHYDWIVPILERRMRNHLNPIIGRQ